MMNINTFFALISSITHVAAVNPVVLQNRDNKTGQVQYHFRNESDSSWNSSKTFSSGTVVFKHPRGLERHFPGDKLAGNFPAMTATGDLGVDSELFVDSRDLNTNVRKLRCRENWRAHWPHQEKKYVQVSNVPRNFNPLWGFFGTSLRSEPQWLWSPQSRTALVQEGPDEQLLDFHDHGYHWLEEAQYVWLTGHKVDHALDSTRLSFFEVWYAEQGTTLGTMEFQQLKRGYVNSIDLQDVEEFPQIEVTISAQQLPAMQQPYQGQNLRGSSSANLQMQSTTMQQPYHDQGQLVPAFDTIIMTPRVLQFREFKNSDEKVFLLRQDSHNEKVLEIDSKYKNLDSGTMMFAPHSSLGASIKKGTENYIVTTEGAEDPDPINRMFLPLSAMPTGGQHDDILYVDSRDLNTNVRMLRRPDWLRASDNYGPYYTYEHINNRIPVSIIHEVSDVQGRLRQQRFTYLQELGIYVQEGQYVWLTGTKRIENPEKPEESIQYSEVWYAANNQIYAEMESSGTMKIRLERGYVRTAYLQELQEGEDSPNLQVRIPRNNQASLAPTNAANLNLLAQRQAMLRPPAAVLSPAALLTQTRSTGPVTQAA